MDIRALTHALAEEVGQKPESHYIRIIDPFTTEEAEGLFEVVSVDFIIPNAIPHVFAAAELYPRQNSRRVGTAEKKVNTRFTSNHENDPRTRTA